MREEVELIESIVPDLIDVLRKRFIILRNIDWSEPVGRRVLAQTLGMSERVLRTETDYLRKQELIASTKSGMILTAKGKRTIQGLSKLMDSLLGLQQMEKELSRYLGIRNCLIVSGDSDRQPLIIEDMGKLVNDILGRELPKGKNVIAAMGGTTMAKVATCLTPEIIGERLDIQANNVCGLMAEKTGGNHRTLYVPEQVSEDTYRPLLNEPVVQEVVNLIRQSNAAVHSIGEAISMAERRSMPKNVLAMLKERKAVSETFGYFFDDKGKVVYKIPRIGLQLEDLANMDCIIAVAGGSSKARAIAAYMKNAPEKTYLITDEGAAKMILKG